MTLRDEGFYYDREAGRQSGSSDTDVPGKPYTTKEMQNQKIIITMA